MASDKYLGCKYATIKIGKNLCKQGIAAYNSVEEIDFKEVIKHENAVLKLIVVMIMPLFLIKQNKTLKK